MTTRPNNVKDKMDKFRSSASGTSGLRDRITAMTEMECYINTRGLSCFCKKEGGE